MPIMWALANPKIGEREVLDAMLELDADLVAQREGILLISDKGFASKTSRRPSPSRASNCQHSGRTFEGVAVRVAQRVLARAAGIWHNNKVGAPVSRSLVAYDH
jgi:hypothetical protein